MTGASFRIWSYSLQSGQNQFEGLFLFAGGLALLRRKPAARWWLIIYAAVAILCNAPAFALTFHDVFLEYRVGGRGELRQFALTIEYVMRDVEGLVLPLLMLFVATRRQLSDWLQR